MISPPNGKGRYIQVISFTNVIPHQYNYAKILPKSYLTGFENSTCTKIINLPFLLRHIYRKHELRISCLVNTEPAQRLNKPFSFNKMNKT